MNSSHMIIKRRVGKDGRVTIPKYIRNLLDLKGKRYIVFEIINNEIWIRAG